MEYAKLQSIIKDRKKPTEKVRWIQPLLRIAAIFIIGLAVYYMPIYNKETTINTLASNTTSVELPDHSSVKLNAESSLKYAKKEWKKNREVNLIGEGYFKVAKGSRFDVVTWAGTVSVLGTQFNVKQRSNFFEVTCYEGLVSVDYKDRNYKVPAGSRIQIIDGKITQSTTNDAAPTWAINNISSFKSTPLGEVIHEFERQYNVKVEITNDIDTLQLFTGSFANNNKELALKSISLPLQLKYDNKGQNVILTKE